MHRMIWLKFGGRTLHLLKLAGALFSFMAVFKVAEASYQVFVEASKLKAAMANPDLIPQFYQWTIDSVSYTRGAVAYSVSSPQDIVGIMTGPFANMLFWLGIAVVAIMIYQAGRVILPLEEYEEKISEHHRNLIAKAVAHAKKAKK